MKSITVAFLLMILFVAASASYDDNSSPEDSYDNSSPEDSYDNSTPDQSYDNSSPDFNVTVSIPDDKGIDLPEDKDSYDNSSPDHSYDNSSPDYNVTDSSPDDKVIDLPNDNKDDDDDLVLGYYRESCPDVERIIFKIVKESFENDYTIAPALIRLHFHDCAVRGCDASILLDHDGSEKTANASKTLRGFEVIEEIKAELEKECPKTVSCADILTAAARDATILVKGPFWSVPYGRKDGRVSHANEADEIVPGGHESVTAQIEFFQSKGLNILDLVTLSGAHTIGRSTCGSMQFRLFNYNGTRDADPSIYPRYLNYLKRKCRWASEYIALDAVTPNTFDNQYYENLQNKMGLLYSDQALYSDLRTAPLVNAFASQSETFLHQFSTSMVKLGNIQDYENSDDGEIRVKCSCVNNAS